MGLHFDPPVSEDGTSGRLSWSDRTILVLGAVLVSGWGALLVWAGLKAYEFLVKTL